MANGENNVPVRVVAVVLAVVERVVPGVVGSFFFSLEVLWSSPGSVAVEEKAG